MSKRRATRPGTSRQRRHPTLDCDPLDPLPQAATGLARCAWLWALRILVSANGMRTFVDEMQFGDDELAQALGLDHWLDLDPDDFDRQAIRSELREMHKLAEDTHMDADHSVQILNANLATITRLLNLTRPEQDLLKFAVLMHFDDTLRLASRYAKPTSLATILGHPESAIREAMYSKAALANCGLLSIDREVAYLQHAFELISDDFSTQIVEAVLDPAELTRGLVNTAPPPVLGLQDFHHVHETLAILRPHLQQALGQRSRGVNVFIYGPPGTGKTQLTRALAAELGYPLFEIACENKKGDPISGERRLRALHATHAFFSGRPTLIAFDEAEDVFNDGIDFLSTQSTAQTHKGWINRALEDNPQPTLWLSNSCDLDPAFLRRFDIVLPIPVPPRSQRLRILRQACGDAVELPCLERLADIEVLAPAVVTRAASVVQGLPLLDPSARSRALDHLIGNTLQAQGHHGLLRLGAQRGPEIYNPTFIHADADLIQVAHGLAHAGSGRLCLYGPPGTGKTAYGHWLARHLEKPLLVRRGSDLLSPYVGKTEQNIAAAFDDAEREGALLLIDEVDSFLLDRRHSVRSWENTQVNEMLTQMERFSGIFIASTNRMDALDQAALRRFDLKVRLDYLQPPQAINLLQRHCEHCGLPPPGPADEQALKRLRTLTPGDFAAVLRQNRFRPIASTAQWVTALQRECSAKEDGQRAGVGFLA